MEFIADSGGLLDNDVEPLTERSLSGLLNLGGTILGTSREKAIQETPVGSLGRQTSFDVKEYS